MEYCRALALCVGGYIIFRRLSVTDEDRVRNVIRAVAQAAEKKSPAGILEHFAPEYRDQFHGFTKDEIRVWLFQLFRQIDSLCIRVTKDEVSVNGTKATAEVAASAEAFAPGSSRGGQIFEGEGTGKFNLDLESVTPLADHRCPASQVPAGGLAVIGRNTGRWELALNKPAKAHTVADFCHFFGKCLQVDDLTWSLKKIYCQWQK